MIMLPSDIDGESSLQRQSMQECLQDTEEVIEWGEEGNRKAAEELCTLRKEHKQAKMDFISTLQKMMDDYADYTNQSENERVKDIVRLSIDMLQTCIHANRHTVWCHNIECIEYPERIRTECYRWVLTNPAAQHFLKQAQDRPRGGGLSPVRP